MSFTKKKKLLLIGIPIGVVVVAAAILLCLLLQPKEEESRMSLAVKSDGNYDPNQTTYIILKGFDWREDYPNTLPFYRFAMPEGYTHTVNAETSANRFSTGYTDQYQTPEGGTLEFYQTLASSNWSFSREGDFQEMTYAGNPVVCYHGEDRSAVFWLYGDSVLTFSADWEMEDNQLLELVSRVFSVPESEIREIRCLTSMVSSAVSGSGPPSVRCHVLPLTASSLAGDPCRGRSSSHQAFTSGSLVKNRCPPISIRFPL